MTGTGQCFWTESNGDSTSVFCDGKQYCNLRTVLDEDVVTVMVAGRQVKYRFAFQLPHDLPPSLDASAHPWRHRNQLIYGAWPTKNSICYTITVVAAMQEYFTSTSSAVSHEITLCSSAAVVPAMMLPASRVHRDDLWDRCLWLKWLHRSSLQLNLTVNRAVFAPKDTITVSIEVASAWTDELPSRLLEVTAQLVMQVTQHACRVTNCSHIMLDSTAVDLTNGAHLPVLQAQLKVPRKITPSFAGDGSEPLSWTYAVKVKAKVAVDSVTPGCCSVQACSSKVPVVIVSEAAMELCCAGMPAALSPVAMAMSRADCVVPNGEVISGSSGRNAYVTADAVPCQEIVEARVVR